MKNSLADDLRESADVCTFGNELMDIADAIEKYCMELPIGSDGEPISIGDKGRRTFGEKIATVEGFVIDSGKMYLKLSNHTVCEPKHFTRESSYDIEQLLNDLLDLRHHIGVQGHSISRNDLNRLNEIIERGNKIHGK